jgi:hypothetical protein
MTIMKKNLAINGGEKTIDKVFPWPLFNETDVNAVTKIVRSGQWGDPDLPNSVVVNMH